MNDTYEESLDGERMLRFPLAERHERVLERLYAAVVASLQGNAGATLLPIRSKVAIRSETVFRPDLAIVTAATGKLWLAAEVISSTDHRADTVLKKLVYEEVRIPRLWMVDPRYNNVEVYHGTEYGMTLKGILAGREVLKDSVMPGLALTMNDLFAD